MRWKEAFYSLDARVCGRRSKSQGWRSHRPRVSLFISLRIMIVRYTFLQQNKLHSSVQVLSTEKWEERAMVV